jgi:hypothetical protein
MKANSFFFKTALIIILLLQWSFRIVAQTDSIKPSYYAIDLATIMSNPDIKKDKNSSHIIVIEDWHGDSLIADGIKLLNVLPGYDYSICIGKSEVNKTLPPLRLESTLMTGILNIQGLDSNKTYLPDTYKIYFKRLRETTIAFASARSENEIPSAYANLRDAVNNIIINNIIPKNEADSSLLKSCKITIQLHPQLIFTAKIRLKKNDVLTIRISRSGVKIDYELRAPEEQQRWFTHYGFVFSPGFISPSREFYSKSDTGSAFVIAKMNNSHKNFLDNFTPTLQFSYRLYPKCKFDPILVGGIGIDFKNPTVQLGFGCLIGQNISLNAGLITAQRYYLKGNYQEGERLTTNIAFDDLHRKMYVPELYFAIGFRFDKNPFVKADDDK